MVSREEIPVERINEYWDIQFQYFVNDGMITTEEEKAHFQSSKYRNVLKDHMLRAPDKLHMAYFVRDGVWIGASQYCIYKSEDGKCFILDFWIFPEHGGMEWDTNAFIRFMNTPKKMVQCIMQKMIHADFGALLVLQTMGLMRMAHR